MRIASFFRKLPHGRVACDLCALYCKIRPGQRGACGVRVNANGTLYTLVADRVVARGVDPIEKKPLFHFYPGSYSYSIATAGCNFRCLHCQNFDISQQPKEKPLAGMPRGADNPEQVRRWLRELESQVGNVTGPAQIVAAAIAAGCQSVSYTYTEPTIFFELARETAELAASCGLANVFVTNGYIAAEPLREIGPVLQAANIDLKSFQERAHRRMTGARLQPVLDSIRRYHRAGIWIEVTTLVVPGHNDSEAELRDIARFVRSVDPAIPWHVTQFYPAYRLLDRPTTPPAVLRRARDIGYEEGLLYVYEGNVPGSEGENTYCHECQACLVRRFGHAVLYNRIQGGRCPECDTQIPGLGMSGS